MVKKSNPFIEKMQEKTGKVLGANKPGKMKRVGGNDIMPKAKPKVPPMKGGKKMCGACMSAKKSSCSHQ
jgi:hypothetical protein